MYAIIIGCGRVGSELAQMLSDEGHNVVVIDRNSSAFSRLSSQFNGITITGSGFSEETLKEAGIERADVVACVTDKDNTNIVSAQVAKKMFGVKKVVARIYDPKREETYHELGLDVIGGTSLIAKLIKERLTERHFVHHLTSGEAEIVEIETKDELAELPVEKIEKKVKTKVFAVVEKDGVKLPEKQMVPKNGSTLIGIRKVERG
jgi:trk system potassium uptake protein TrkA